MIINVNQPNGNPSSALNTFFTTWMHLNTVPTGFNAFLKNVKKIQESLIYIYMVTLKKMPIIYMTIISYVTEDASYILSKEAFKFSKKHYPT